jgi:3-hydroxyisobutyrate dehydrogenase
MNLGFIGLGQMGKHMGARLFGAGHRLTAHDLRKEAAAALLEKGALCREAPGPGALV